MEEEESEEEESEDEEKEDGPFGYASSPSQLHVKCQEDDYEDEYGVYQDIPQRHYGQEYQEEMVSVPSSLITDLQFMLADYKKRHPTPHISKQIPVVPRPRSIPSMPVRSQAISTEPLL